MAGTANRALVACAFGCFPSFGIRCFLLLNFRKRRLGGGGVGYWRRLSPVPHPRGGRPFCQKPAQV